MEYWNFLADSNIIEEVEYNEVNEHVHVPVDNEVECDSDELNNPIPTEGSVHRKKRKLTSTEGLKEIDSSVMKVRESIKYVKGSQSRKQKFLECVSQSYLADNKGLRQDVPTRWNSTFIMLDSAIYFRRAFMHLELGDSNYKCCPTNDEWEKMINICKFLAPFYEITNSISGSKYTTANLYFPCISTAYATLKYEMSCGPDYIKKMTFGMIAKFEKYWSDFSIILAIAVILDPRYKFNFVEWCYKKLYVGDYMAELEKVKDNLENLFSCYATTNEEISTPESQTSQSLTQRTSSISNSSTILKSQFLQVILFYFSI
ncbi:hypothetical protein KFK09_026254 [Dendrobium nobile]|uniref:hAT-like transposase RNase-H fold domain-containing protein n=1 Tax=Dendrobium nobile TaxID=94219 RepID=A0A8T3A7T8_DENNO|nr:hypothetical protein KFK09_026254 [Dendrobium nobile]